MRIFFVGLVLGFAGAVAVLPVGAMASTEGVLLSNSNMRSMPMVQAGNIISVLPLGSRVQVLVQGQGWNLVSKDYTQMGWVASRLMSVQPTQATQTTQPTVHTTPALQVQPAEPEKTYGVVQLNSNLRTAPMQTILQVVSKGSTVEILLLENKWYKVQTQEGRIGWIAEWLIKSVIQEQPKLHTQVETASTQQEIGIVPASIDTQELNAYWLSKVNTLRSAAGLRLLKQSDILSKTAATWADYMGTIKSLTHIRSNGLDMHEWAAAQGIPFADRYGIHGWQTNYFTENISRNPAQANMDFAKVALDVMLASFVAENNGPHYRTVYHEDWNSVGAGFYFDPVGNGTYQMYAAFHYASLAQ